MIIIGNDKHEISQLQDYLVTKFEMKNLDTGMLDCRPVDIPIIQNHLVGEYPDQVPTNKERYQRLVGRLIYLSYTRPYIAYAVSIINQFIHSPSEDHMNAIIRILRYLKFAPRNGLVLSKHGHLNIDGYTDADWARFRGMTKGICKLIWLKRLLTELGYKPMLTLKNGSALLRPP
ncbi:unnamed protein product [Prunus brigantina]